VLVEGLSLWCAAERRMTSITMPRAQPNPPQMMPARAMPPFVASRRWTLRRPTMPRITASTPRMMASGERQKTTAETIPTTSEAVPVPLSGASGIPGQP
jgi:hypothetical protein